MRWRVVAVIGRVLVGAGLLVMVFVAYELWGTGVVAARSQARLRAQLSAELPAGAAATRMSLLHEASGLAHLAPASGGPATTRTAPGWRAPATAPVQPTPPDGQPVAELEIPSIGLDMVVVQGVAAPDLALGPGHYPGTPLPGEAGNVAIAGHRTTYLHPFYNLTAVKPGTLVVLTTSEGVFVYVAGTESAVAPTDVAVIGPGSADTLTLTTCNPRYSAATRLVLRATLSRSLLFSFDPHPGTSGRHHHLGAATVGGTPVRRSDVQVAGQPDGAARPGVMPAIGWGAAVVVAAGATWAASRRAGRRRWPVLIGVWLPGAALTLVALLLFFGALTPLLPASY